jgi:hypothetical protein
LPFACPERPEHVRRLREFFNKARLSTAFTAPLSAVRRPDFVSFHFVSFHFVSFRWFYGILLHKEFGGSTLRPTNLFPSISVDCRLIVRFPVSQSFLSMFCHIRMGSWRTVTYRNVTLGLGRLLNTPFPARLRVGSVTPLCLSSKSCDHPTLWRLISDEDMVLGFSKPDAILICEYISRYIPPDPLHLYLGRSGGLASTIMVPVGPVVNQSRLEMHASHVVAN